MGIALPSDLQSFLVKEFHWFHRNPELSHKEYLTTQRICEILHHEGIEILDTSLDTGVVAIVRGQTNFKRTTALRGDIDALPIEEKTGLSYRSAVPGVMHACGHDFHLTTILGAAILLQRNVSNVHGMVKLIFQPAEEVIQGGATEVIESGVLDDVDSIFGIHSTSLLPVGTLSIGSGPISAAVDEFSIRVEGDQMHGAHADKGVDGVVIASAIILNLQSIVSRNLSPTHEGVVSIGKVVADGAWNVIPDTVVMEGTIRSFYSSDRMLIKRRLEAIASSTARAFGGEAAVLWKLGPPSVTNDPNLIDIMRDVALQNEFTVVDSIVSMGGEDFSYYQQKIPGAFINVGTGKLKVSNHSSMFKVDTSDLERDALYIARVACEFLNRSNRNL